MAKNLPAKPGKTWTPNAPLKIDWNQAREGDTGDTALTHALDHTDNPLFSKGVGSKQPLKPANHKSHIRQKKV